MKVFVVIVLSAIVAYASAEEPTLQNLQVKVLNILDLKLLSDQTPVVDPDTGLAAPAAPISFDPCSIRTWGMPACFAQCLARGYSGGVCTIPPKCQCVQFAVPST